VPQLPIERSDPRKTARRLPDASGEAVTPSHGQRWPQAVQRLVLIGHGMGGLRPATWPQRVPQAAAFLH
jgi:hypothetical protein